MGGPTDMKAIKSDPMKPRTKYDESFKRQAVENWLASGKSAEVVGKELGVKSSRLYDWRQQFAPAPVEVRTELPGKPRSQAELQTLLEAAQREMAHLREQRDILKKTLGILSEPSVNAAKGSTR